MLKKFELDKKAVSQLMLSREAQDVLEEYANSALQKLGEGHDKEVRLGRNRANVRIFVTTSEAYGKSMKENTLLKAVGHK